MPVNGYTILKQPKLSTLLFRSDNVAVSKVEIYADGKLLITDTASPYTAK